MPVSATLIHMVAYCLQALRWNAIVLKPTRKATLMPGHLSTWKALLVTILVTHGYTVCSTKSTNSKHASRNVPNAAAHNAAMHIVIAMYQEDIIEVQQYVDQLLSIPTIDKSQPTIYLYVKGGQHLVEQAKRRGFAHNVIERPNIGREQETYIRHIVTHYDNLPQHSFFTQALPNHNGDFVISRLKSQFSTRTGVLGLANVEVCTCEGHSDVFSEYGSGGLIRLREVLPCVTTCSPSRPPRRRLAQQSIIVDGPRYIRRPLGQSPSLRKCSYRFHQQCLWGVCDFQMRCCNLP